MMDKKIITDLRMAYDKKASWRDQRPMTAWKTAERAHFLQQLQQEKKQTLLEIGAGPGRDSLFFQNQGLTVTATDLSPEMVKLCQQKGLTAHVMGFEELHFAQPFDAVYALNCLLHVPKQTLPAILRRIRSLLNPGGLFFMGVYGGQDFEGILPDDHHDPHRFFALYTDEAVQQVVGQIFTPVYFKSIPLDKPDSCFQSMIWRR